MTWWASFTWLRVGYSGEFLCVGSLILGFHKGRGISWSTKTLVKS